MSSDLQLEAIKAKARDFYAAQDDLGRMIRERAASLTRDVAAFRAKLPEKLRILWITPCDDGHKLCFWDSLRAFEKTPDPSGNVHEVMTPYGDSLIPRARNNYTEVFRVSEGFDAVGWLDSDLDFTPRDPWRMAAHRLPIVAGAYYVKEVKPRLCVNPLPGEEVDQQTGLWRVAKAGSGAILIHRCVIADMIAAAEWWPFWRIRYIDDHTREERYHLWHHGVVNDPTDDHSPRDLSEDWGFCYLARMIGYDVWQDTRAVFLHRGEINFPLHARRLTKEEADKGVIAQPDGGITPIQQSKPETV